ncbi:MAG TPA: hypothetical protein VGB85_00230 [Nannocystis sp.]|jgi:cysteine-rich repeat protein
MVVTRPGAVALMLAATACGGEDGDSRADPSVASFASVGNTSESTVDATSTTTGEQAPTTTGSGGASSSGSGDEPTTGALGTTGEASSSEGGESSSTGVMVGCGDGVIDAPEVCDDANQVDGDGCNNDCTLSGQLLWESTQEGGVGLADEGIGCAIDGTGSILVTGYLSVGPGDDDLWVRKYSFSGVPVWTHTHPGTGLVKDQGRAVVVDVAELPYVAGLTNTLMQDNDVFVRKFAADGMPMWTKAYSGPAMLADAGSAAALTPDGGLLVAGATTVVDAGTNTWLRKYSPEGMTLWTRTYAGAAKGNDATHALAVTADGFIYAAGQEGVAGEGANVWLGKYDPDGNLIWSKIYSGAAGKNDYLYGAVAMDDGGVVVCGYETAIEIPWKSFLRRYDAAGLAVWTEVDPGPEMLGALCYSVDLATNGDILFAGAVMQGTTREPRVRRLTPDGVELWSTVVPGAGEEVSQARCVKGAPDGTIVVTGSQDVGVDGRDIWVARFGP